MIRFEDRSALSGIHITQDGYLVTQALAVRTGIQEYYGHELGLTDERRDQIVRVYRSEEEVRSPASLTTFSHAPVTDGHPPVSVAAENWADLAKGEVSTEASWEDNHIRLPLIIKDGELIKKVQAGTRDLSAGYSAQIVFGDGVTPEGETYDAKQTNIRINHLAVVQAGRAGSARIGDTRPSETWGATPRHAEKENTMNLQTILVDGLSIQVTDQGAQAIKKLQDALTKVTGDLETERAAHTKAIDDKDREFAKVEAERDTALEKVLDDKALDDAVKVRSDLLEDARLVHAEGVFAGLSLADVRKAVVAHKLGDEKVKDRADAYIEARFDTLVDAAKEVLKKDPLVRAMDGAPTQSLSADDPQTHRQAMIDELNGTNKN
jgi:hypothetical protein